MRTYAVVFKWQQVELIADDGVATRCWAMVPLPRYDNVCKRQYAEGETYPLEIAEERSMASHKAYFAALNEGFKNLPERYAARFPSVEHLRKWLLIETGWCEEKEFEECKSPKGAKDLRTYMRTQDAYVRINNHPTIVVVRKAVSQSMAAMGKKKFEASKRDVLDMLESMIEIPKGTLMREAGRSA